MNKFADLEISLHRQDAESYAVVISSDGSRLAAGLCSSPVKPEAPCVQNEILVWTIPDKTMTDQITVDTDQVTGLAFSQDSHTLATASQDGVITFWDDSEGRGYQEIVSLAFSNAGGFTSLTLSPNDQLLAVGYKIGKVIMLDVETLSLYGDAFVGPLNPITSLAFNPDASLLASGSQAGTVTLWDLNVEEWKSRACELAGRNLSLDEWDTYIKLPLSKYQKTCEQWPDGQ